jgi:hypothetical protein
MGGMISFLDFTLANLDAQPRVVSLLDPLPVRNIPGLLGGPRLAFRLPSAAASNNAVNIKPAPGSIFGISGMIASAATAVYLKLYDEPAAPNPATDVPLYMFGLTFAGGPTGRFNFQLPMGLDFPHGISAALVRGPADLNNTPIAAGQVLALNIPFV